MGLIRGGGENRHNQALFLLEKLLWSLNLSLCVCLTLVTWFVLSKRIPIGFKVCFCTWTKSQRSYCKKLSSNPLWFRCAIILIQKTIWTFKQVIHLLKLSLRLIRGLLPHWFNGAKVWMSFRPREWRETFMTVINTASCSQSSQQGPHSSASS